MGDEGRLAALMSLASMRGTPWRVVRLVPLRQQPAHRLVARAQVRSGQCRRHTEVSPAAGGNSDKVDAEELGRRSSSGRPEKYHAPGWYITSATVAHCSRLTMARFCSTTSISV